MKEVKRKKRRKPSAEKKRPENTKIPRKRKKGSAAYKKKKKKQMLLAQKRKRQKKFIRDLVLTLFVTLTVFSILFFSFFTFSKVKGYSMSSTLMSKDWVLVNKKKKLRTFQLVLLRSPDKQKLEVRRIIGKPGELINYEKDELKINGEVKDEPFLSEKKNQAREYQFEYTKDFSLYDLTKKTTIPEEKYFVLGDNRPYSTDSRDYGLVDKKDIIGVVEMRLLPFHKIMMF